MSLTLGATILIAEVPVFSGGVGYVIKRMVDTMLSRNEEQHRQNRESIAKLEKLEKDNNTAIVKRLGDQDGALGLLLQQVLPANQPPLRDIVMQLQAQARQSGGFA